MHLCALLQIRYRPHVRAPEQFLTDVFNTCLKELA